MLHNCRVFLKASKKKKEKQISKHTQKEKRKKKKEKKSNVRLMHVSLCQTKRVMLL
jgi:microcompartment protein CcmL/EutN